MTHADYQEPAPSKSVGDVRCGGGNQEMDDERDAYGDQEHT